MVCTVSGVECMSFITYLLLKVVDIPVYYRHVNRFSLFIFILQKEKEFCESLQEITSLIKILVWRIVCTWDISSSPISTFIMKSAFQNEFSSTEAIKIE